MNDKQIADLLSQIKEFFTPLYVLFAFSLVALLFICFILFCDYNDKCYIRKKKDNIDELRAICREEFKKCK